MPKIYIHLTTQEQARRLAAPTGVPGARTLKAICTQKTIGGPDESSGQRVGATLMAEMAVVEHETEAGMEAGIRRSHVGAGAVAQRLDFAVVCPESQPASLPPASAALALAVDGITMRVGPAKAATWRR